MGPFSWNRMVQSDDEPFPVGIGPRCPVCGNHARLEDGGCVCCTARAVAAEAGRVADAFMAAAAKRLEKLADNETIDP